MAEESDGERRCKSEMLNAEQIAPNKSDFSALWLLHLVGKGTSSIDCNIEND